MPATDAPVLPDETTSPSLDALIDLHRFAVDTQRGFEMMADKAEPDFRPVVERFVALHLRHAARLDVMVREMGAVPGEDGSFRGTVNRVAIAVRAVLGTIDARALRQIRRSEVPVLAAFDHALTVSLPQGHMQALGQMQAEVVALLEDTRSLA